MPQGLTFTLDPIRTDGWFERIGEGIGSFQALCEIIGPRFFAFAMITGARITSLTVDRRNSENTLVDFAVGPQDAEVTDLDTQRLTLSDFRKRLVSALIQEEPIAPPPERPTDLEALQLHVGVRYLLLSPLYGYSLKTLESGPDGSRITVQHDGVDESYQLSAFRSRLRAHVREELERAVRGAHKGAIDLSRVPEAAAAAERGDHVRVLELLGTWPAPLAIFLRTPDGQLLVPETRSTIARALGLLGSACIALGEVEKGEEVLRLGVQYAGDGDAAAEIYRRLGESMLEDHRPGEAISPLRRAVNLGADARRIWPELAQAFLARGRLTAAFGALVEAEEAGVAAIDLAALWTELESRFGGHIGKWKSVVEGNAPPTPLAGLTAAPGGD